MPATRRTLLASLGTAVAAGLAGCSGSSSSSTPDCSTGNANRGDAELIHGATATVEDGEVRFVVSFLEDAEMTELDVVKVFDAAGDEGFSIPIVAGNGPMGTRRRYAQTLGPRPRHGRYVVVVFDESGEPVDRVTADVNCIVESTPE